MIDFNDYVLDKKCMIGTVVQPRMGFSDLSDMRAGLLATASCNANAVCTITLDSFTRTNNFKAASLAMENGSKLNGYPIVNHSSISTRELISEIEEKYSVPIQIRHGSPLPSKIFKRMIEVGANATEGGPISYCLPYSRVPLKDAIKDWNIACSFLAEGDSKSHIETFSGCMLGQLCDPAILIAFNIIEAIFLKNCGINSISFSYAQGTSSIQDRSSIRALKKLADIYLKNTSYHIVAYVFMGFFPKTIGGFCRITNEILSLSNIEEISRVIVKTPVESSRIPRVIENIAALEYCSAQLDDLNIYKAAFDDEEFDRVFNVANNIILKVLNSDKDLGNAILKSFDSGVLSLPYCLHQDNKHKSFIEIDERGYCKVSGKYNLTSNSGSLLKNLRSNINKYDKFI